MIEILFARQTWLTNASGNNILLSGGGVNTPPLWTNYTVPASGATQNSILQASTPNVMTFTTSPVLSAVTLITGGNFGLQDSHGVTGAGLTMSTDTLWITSSPNSGTVQIVDSTQFPYFTCQGGNTVGDLVNGILLIQGSIVNRNQEFVQVTATKPATATNSASLVTQGGLGVAGAGYFGGGIISSPLSHVYMYTIIGVNLNSANTDTAVPITLPPGYTRFNVNFVVISNPSVVINTASLGVFTNTGGGGATIAANTTLALSSTADNTPGNSQSLSVSNQNTTSYKVSTLPVTPNIYIRVGTAQGSAATADVTIALRLLP